MEQRSAWNAARFPGCQVFLLCSSLLAGCARDWGVDAHELDTRVDAEVGSQDGSPRDTSPAPTIDTDEPDASLREPDASGPLDAMHEADASNFMLIDAEQPDAGAQDAALPDAPLPDAAAADAATTRFCATQQAPFCADFEDGGLDMFSWQELTETSGAKVEVVEQGPGQRAFKATLTGVGEEAARVSLWLEDGEPAWFHAAFDFLPQFNLPAQGGTVFWFKVSEQTGTMFPGVGFTSDQDGSALIIHRFDGASEAYEAYPMSRLPADWVHVDVMITFGASGTVSVRFNDALAAVYTGPLHVDAVTQTYLQLGVYAQDKIAPSALYDNLVVEWAP